MPASIGRADVLARLKTAWAPRPRPAPDRVGVGRGGRRQDAPSSNASCARSASGHCAYGHCVEQYGAGEPHLPILEALTDLSRRDPSLVDLIRAVAPTWLFQLPWLSSRRRARGVAARAVRRGPGPDAARDGRAPRSLHRGAPAAAGHRGPALERPRHGAAHRLPRAPSLAGAAAVARKLPRDELIAADHPLATVRHELRLHGLGAEIAARRLHSGGGRRVRRGARAVARRRAALVRALHDRTDGLPLFVAGVVDDSSHDRRRDGDPHARLAAMAIPDTLSGVIERYVEDYAEQRSLLEAASVCGVQFRLSTVARVLDVDAMALAEACAELARGQRWLKDLRSRANSAALESGYVFRHALYREVLYKRVGRLARVELHRKVAAALERERAQGLNVGAAELASHLDLAREPMAALGYYAEAAESALLHFSPAQTLSLTERAMALLPQVEPSAAPAALEMTLATLRGTAAMQVKGFSSPDVKQAFERALSLLDDVPQHPLRGLVLSVLGLAYEMRGELEQAAAIARRSEALWQANGRSNGAGLRLPRARPAGARLAGGRASRASGWRRESARWRSSTRARRGRCSPPTPA